MRRRQLLLAALGLPLAARSQTSDVALIGFLGTESATEYAANLDGLRAGLRERGYVEGKNLRIESRWAEGKHERLPALAAELARLKPRLIVTHGTPGTLAAK